MSSESVRAIIFDLYGTLVPGGTRAERDQVIRVVAGDLGVDPDALTVLIRDSYDARARGHYGDPAATLRALAVELGGRPSESAVDTAVRRRLDQARGLLEATWALPVLDQLLRRGLAVGLVSDCSAETPLCWPGTELASRITATAFSCVVGVRKPDPKIYLQVTEALGVKTEQCVYVGDGGSQELTGARSLGMRAILVRDGNGDDGVDRPNAEVDWRGERIATLDDLLELV